MSAGVAFVSTATEVLDAWTAYQEYFDGVRGRRKAVSDRYGRRLMVNRLGFGHGTRVVGFEQLDSDVDGTVIGDNGELRVPKVGPPYSTVVPNTRRKAGKDLRDELATLNDEGPDLPGMPTFVLTGLRALSPALFKHDGAIWAYWGEDVTDNHTGGEFDLHFWQRRPLSAYYAVVEAREAAEGHR